MNYLDNKIVIDHPIVCDCKIGKQKSIEYENRKTKIKNYKFFLFILIISIYIYT